MAMRIYMKKQGTGSEPGEIPPTGTPTTWDPINKGTSVSISGGNLTATTNGSGYGIARSVVGVQVNQRRVWEMYIAGGTPCSVGFGEITDYNTYLGNGGGIAYFSHNGVMQMGTTAYGGFDTFTTGDTIVFELDRFINSVTVYKNGIEQGTLDLNTTPISGTVWYATAGISVPNVQMNTVANFDRPYSITPRENFYDILA